MPRMRIGSGTNCRSVKVFPISQVQMDDLEAFIMRSPDASPIGKKAVLWMLRQTELLSKPVALSIPPLAEDPPDEKRDPSNLESLGSSTQVSYSVHDMNSSNGKTRLGKFLDGLGTPMCFASGCGRYQEEGFIPSAGGHTVWIGLEPWGSIDPSLYRLLPFDRDAILATHLSTDE